MNRNNVIDLYFIAWKTHDIALVQEIFTSEAIYRILPIQKELRGIDEISAYWLRNKRRQSGVEITWREESKYLNVRDVRFFASFRDIEEKNHQIIWGCINFYINDQGLIYLLSETYEKRTYNDISDVFEHKDAIHRF
jgi:hypothetical protein